MSDSAAPSSPDSDVVMEFTLCSDDGTCPDDTMSLVNHDCALDGVPLQEALQRGDGSDRSDRPSFRRSTANEELPEVPTSESDVDSPRGDDSASNCDDENAGTSHNGADAAAGPTDDAQNNECSDDDSDDGNTNVSSIQGLPSSDAGTEGDSDRSDATSIYLLPAAAPGPPQPPGPVPVLPHGRAIRIVFRHEMRVEITLAPGGTPVTRVVFDHWTQVHYV